MDNTELVKSYVGTMRTICLILCFASIISHKLAGLTIWRNNVLKKPLYMYILSVISNNAIGLLLILINYLLRNVLPYSVLSYFGQIIMILQAANILTLIAVTLRNPVRPDVYTRYITGIWIITILAVLLFTIIYFAFDVLIFSVLRVATFIELLVLLVLLIGCRVIHRKERGDYALQLNFVSLYICCHMFYILWTFIEFATNISAAMVIEYVKIQTACYGVANAIALMFFDRKYKICLIETIKCSKTRYYDTHENANEGRNDALLSPTS